MAGREVHRGERRVEGLPPAMRRRQLGDVCRRGALVVAEHGHERALDEVRHGRRVSKYTGNPLVLCIIRIKIILKLIMYSSR